MYEEMEQKLDEVENFLKDVFDIKNFLTSHKVCSKYCFVTVNN